VAVVARRLEAHSGALEIVRVDSFQYFTAGHPPEHLGPILARNRFDGSIAVSPAGVDPREWLVLVRGHGFVKGAVAWLDLDDPDLGLLLDECRQYPKFRGVFHPFAQSVPSGLGELVRRGLTLDLQVTRLAQAAEIASRFPGLPVSIAHLGSPHLAAGSDDWARGIAGLARFPQIFCKASDLIHLTPSPWKGADLRPLVQHVLAAFSPARVMFGSGWPRGLPGHIWKETLAAFTQAIGAQSMEVREELLGGTAAQFYRIGDSPSHS
jgi:L-fuconolactonase